MEWSTGLAVRQNDFPHGPGDEVDRFVGKEYNYHISLEADDACVEALRLYLNENMKKESGVELWSIRLGGDYTKHYKTKVPMKNIPADKLEMAEDDIDWYKENFVIPTRRKVTIEALTTEDILFVLENISACLEIQKKAVSVSDTA